jgi:valyl-tRNA synthetase
MQEIIVALRNIRAEMKLDPKKKIGAELFSGDADTRSFVERNRAGILRLAILSELKVLAERLPQSGGAVRSTSQFDIRIAYSEAVDVEAEKARLKKEIDGLQKAVTSKEKQLADETFRSRAPEKIIRGLEATLAVQLVELEKNLERLGQL